jgi:diadenosine tetraphosphate (Ap4A) HIT family hydrolase
MEGCAFCVLPEIKEREVANNNLARAFLTNIPIVPGHVLIIPTRCVAKYEDLDNQEQAAIEILRFKILAALKKSFGAEGFNFAWNDGKTAGQSVTHFHLHIIPRKPGDTGITQYEPREFVYRPAKERPVSSEQELKEVAEMIKNNLDG